MWSLILHGLREYLKDLAFEAIIDYLNDERYVKNVYVDWSHHWFDYILIIVSVTLKDYELLSSCPISAFLWFYICVISTQNDCTCDMILQKNIITYL